MSKRFGRNQRRRFRQELATAQADAVKFKTSDEMNRGLLVYQRERIKDLEAFAEEVFEIVGRQSILNPNPEPIQVAGSPSSFQLMDIPRLSLANLDSFNAKQCMSVTLNVLQTKVEQDKFRGVVHCLATLDGGKVAYSISRQAVEMLPKKILVDRLTREIVRQLAVQLAEELKQ